MKKSVRDRLLRAFRMEALEVLDPLRQEVEGLHDRRGAELRRSVDECMRRLHNIKGSSTVVGLPQLASLAHTLEDAMAPLRSSEAAPSEKWLEPFVDALAEVERMIHGEDATRALAEWREALGLSSIDAEPKPGSSPAPPPSAGAPPPPPAPERTPETKPKPKREEADASRERSQTVRIEAARLDELLSHSAELLAVRGRLAGRSDGLLRLLEDFSDTLGAARAGEQARWTPLLGALEELVQSDRRENVVLTRVTSALQGSMRRLRMLPLTAAAPTWRSAVADAASRLHKQARLVVDVGSIEIDKEVLDRLHDPIIHILRNAVDHGIESAEERKAAGKSPRGQVRVSASHEQGLVRLAIGDDGRGVRPASIGEAAVRKGVISSDDAASLTDREAIDLLFAPGFSTRDEVSAVSGRGVGLNEVRGAIEEIGGRVEVVTGESGEGGEFRLYFPVSMLTTRGLLVQVEQEIYAIPIQSVERVLRVDAEELGTVEGMPALRIADEEAIRVRWLSEATLGRRPRPRGVLRLVILDVHGSRMAIVVDQVLREDEFVIRPLPWNFRSVAGVGGVVPLADGRVAIAIDVSQLVASMAGSVMEPGGSGDEASSTRRVLVVDDSLSTRNLHASLLRSEGYEVETSVDGEEAWEKLARSRFDVLVSDVQMPRLDGFELTERVRSDERLGGLPVILVTSAEEPSIEERARRAGADVFLLKSKFEKQRLLDALASAQELRR